ncbi:site-specific integrase (plasmid) [Peteryoungia desertarenae]|uniref:Site-specific integrase n=1 Tax=Peteryoungia desertarenae TaxID=1813451 RepID=A0ABX6QT85_9HYPH|nr:site-specific integrase [Peteryoungia desertarenae]QLF71527.1 site-specific integrase [Peteryoungia desertarenae]
MSDKECHPPLIAITRRRDEGTSIQEALGVDRGDPITTGSVHTRRAYASDWQHFSRWCRHHGHAALAPDPAVIKQYIEACATGEGNSLSTIERRLSALVWNYRQRGLRLDRRDERIKHVMQDIRTKRDRATLPKQGVDAADIVAMISTLDPGTLRGIRDRAMLLLTFAGGLRRSELVGLDLGPKQTTGSLGFVEILPEGILIKLATKTGWREIEVGRGVSQQTCPVTALMRWIEFSRIAHGPLFRRVRGRGKQVGPDRLNDKEVARLVKKTALAAGLSAHLGHVERYLRFSAHSLRVARNAADKTETSPEQPENFRFNITRQLGL